MIRLDHFVLGVEQLDLGIKDFYDVAGVKPEFSGRHASLGTYNALVTLESNSYFELLATDPNPPVPPQRQVQGLVDLKGQKMIAWYLGCDNFKEVEESLKPFSLNLSTIGSGERIDAKGLTLKYEFSKIEGLDQLCEAVPYIIRWLPETIHPSLTSPKGCRFKSTTITHGESEAFTAWINALNLGINLLRGKTNIAVEMSTLKGSASF